MNDFQLGASDIITFHNYKPAADLENQISELKRLGRPLICTEWMARTNGSLVHTILPVFPREKVGCLNWGLVAGKTNTIHPWQTTVSILNPRGWFKKKGARVSEPKVWFHDLFRADGTPYDSTEIEMFRKFTQR